MIVCMLNNDQNKNNWTELTELNLALLLFLFQIKMQFVGSIYKPRDPFYGHRLELYFYLRFVVKA